MTPRDDDSTSPHTSRKHWLNCCCSHLRGWLPTPLPLCSSRQAGGEVRERGRGGGSQENLTNCLKPMMDDPSSLPLSNWILYPARCRARGGIHRVAVQAALHLLLALAMMALALRMMLTGRRRGRCGFGGCGRGGEEEERFGRRVGRQQWDEESFWGKWRLRQLLSNVEEVEEGDVG